MGVNVLAVVASKYFGVVILVDVPYAYSTGIDCLVVMHGRKLKSWTASFFQPCAPRRMTLFHTNNPGETVGSIVETRNSPL